MGLIAQEEIATEIHAAKAEEILSPAEERLVTICWLLLKEVEQLTERIKRLEEWRGQ